MSSHDDALEYLQVLEGEGDWEMAHAEADKVICTFLRDLGYDELVDAWERVGKWYA